MKHRVPMVTHPEYSFPFASKHRFPMEKFSLLSELLAHRGLLKSSNLFRPGRTRRELMALAHCPHYIEAFTNNTLDSKALRRLGLPWSEGLIKRSWIAPNGTFLTAQLALRHGIACHLAGGTHHAHRSFGSGFCAFNDLAVAASGLLAQGSAKRVLIFDCDVHQGDGTATILADTPEIFTCSIHCDKNFPAKKAQSDLDVEVPRGCTDSDYLAIVESTLKQTIAALNPDLVFYDAGVDIYQHDPLGLLNISLDGLRRRDRLVLEYCSGKGIPIATVIGGGYDDDRHALVERHAIVVEESQRCFSDLG